MRLGVLDIGSNTGHLLVVDAHDGAAPLPARRRGASRPTDANRMVERRYLLIELPPVQYE